MRRDKPGELQSAVAVRRAHHRNLDALISQSSDTPGPFSFDRGPPFQLEAELTKELNGRCEVIDNDSYVVHPFKRHLPNLYGGAYSDNRPRSDLGEGAVRVHLNQLRFCVRTVSDTPRNPGVTPSFT